MLLPERIYHQRGEASMAQGLLPFQYEIEQRWGAHCACGLPAYVEFAHTMGFGRLISEHVRVRQGNQGGRTSPVINPQI